MREREKERGGESDKHTIRARLRPMTSLRSGDPKQEAIPIPGFPALATAVSATQSPTELPIARTVSPKIPVLIVYNISILTIYKYSMQ